MRTSSEQAVLKLTIVVERADSVLTVVVPHPYGMELSMPPREHELPLVGDPFLVAAHATGVLDGTLTWKYSPRQGEAAATLELTQAPLA